MNKIVDELIILSAGANSNYVQLIVKRLLPLAREQEEELNRLREASEIMKEHLSEIRVALINRIPHKGNCISMDTAGKECSCGWLEKILKETKEYYE